MGDLVEQLLAKPIQLADQVIKAAADAAPSFKAECSELKSKTEKLSALLRNAARASNELYERPARRIIDDTDQVLEKALSLVLRCRGHGNIMKRVFTILPAAAFRKMSAQLENSIGDVSWLLRVSASADDRADEYLGLPPIATNEPILCLIWEQIATLYTGSADNKVDAAASLLSLARDNQRYGKLIIDEGGVGPLLKLVKEGKAEGQENAARAIGCLINDPESVEHMILAGVCSVFAKVLKEGPMKVQAVVAWAVSELARHDPKCQDFFAQHNIIRLLVSHLAFETVQEHSKYAVVSKATSVHQAVVLASNSNSSYDDYNVGKGVHGFDGDKARVPHPSGKNYGTQMHGVVESTMALNASKTGNQTQNNTSYGSNTKASSVQNQQHQHSVSVSGTHNKAREMDDPQTKSYMKAMSARALWHLAKGNPPICKSITESRALLCFAVLLEKGPVDVQYNSAMAIVEITAVAEQDPDLRKSAFNPSSPACKAVVDQLLRIIEKEQFDDLLIPCIKSIGNLSRTFRATETRMISPLVKLLEETYPEVEREACIALTKFACTENYLHLDHSKAIINAGGARHLVQLVYLGEQIVQCTALILLCYIAKDVPDSEELAQAGVLAVLQWASKQAFLIQDEVVDALLPDAKCRMELYQSRLSRGYH